ncbi:hypothetical protein Tco_0939240 [Tanacetum coccineum]|uniref:Phospholipase-like protein n=1 Tax=Tanacetum coccineum TaxID=301880 RepID=A0ABQ5DJJ0_9ASTR
MNYEVAPQVVFRCVVILGVLQFAISHHDVVRVCLLLVPTIVFMGRESSYYIPDNVLELVDDFPAWNTYPWGEYFWRTLYLRTLNVVPRKNERDLKKKKKVQETPKKKKKTYNFYGFVLSLKGNIFFLLES